MPQATSAPPSRRRKVAAPAGPTVIYVLSDFTGNLARHMLAAFVTQFPGGSLAIKAEQFVRTPEHAHQVLDRAKAESAAVCHAIIGQSLKQMVTRFCQRAKLPCLDLTGGIMHFLTGATGIQPLNNVEALHRLDEAYKRRIGAIEFTLAHDDGLGATLDHADVVLAGISRTSKTPTSMYLAQQGYRVANVALALGVDPPPQLQSLPREKVVGLLIDPQQLVMIRARRQAGWRMEQTSYAEPHHVVREIAWARRLFSASGWRTLDVTDQAIEETAARIIALVGPPAAADRPGATVELE